MSEIRREIIRAARSYVGVPFKHQGRTLDGLDCIGLIVCVMHRVGLSDADFTAYGRLPNPTIFNEQMARHFRRTLKREPGDILVFSLPAFPCHLGIFTDLNTVIHALSRRNCVVEHTLARTWEKKIRSIWAFPQAEKWRNLL